MSDEYEVVVYQTKRGREPFGQWLKSLKDRTAQKLILRRIQRLRQGNFGDTKILAGGAGVRELRIAYGPGYRVYFAKSGARLVVLLAGGTKRSQERDIVQAKKYLLDYKEES